MSLKTVKLGDNMYGIITDCGGYYYCFIANEWVLGRCNSFLPKYEVNKAKKLLETNAKNERILGNFTLVQQSYKEVDLGCEYDCELVEIDSEKGGAFDAGILIFWAIAVACAGWLLEGLLNNVL